MRSFAVMFGVVLVAACAQGVAPTDDDDNSAVGGASASGPGPSTGVGAECPVGQTKCGDVCADLLINVFHCGDCDQPCLETEMCVDGVCVPPGAPSSSSASGATSSSTSSTASSVASSSVASSSSSGGGGTCNPLNPAPVCGPNMHCLPQPDGIPTCEGPTGPNGQDYFCNTSADCMPATECVSDGFDTWCLQWCDLAKFGADCPSGYPYNCEKLTIPVYVGGVEYGVCY